MKLIILAALSILTVSQGEVQIPAETIRSITYDKTSGSDMYVNTTTGTQTFALSDVVRMSITDAPQPTALETLSADEAADVQKILLNGTVYVIRDGKWYAIKGEELQ